MALFGTDTTEKKEKKKAPVSAPAKELKIEASRASGILLSPHITEKATRLAEGGTYVFKVADRATKPDIKKAIEGLYGVHVRKVTVVNSQGKNVSVGRHRGKSKDWRKAMITLQKGQIITL